MPGFKHFYATGCGEEGHLSGVLALPGVHNDSFFGRSTHGMWCVFLHFDEAWTAGEVRQMLGEEYRVDEVDADSAHERAAQVLKHIEDVRKAAEGAPAGDGAAGIFSELFDEVIREGVVEVLGEAAREVGVDAADTARIDAALDEVRVLMGW